MFARHARPGWSAWGKRVQREVEPKGKPTRGYLRRCDRVLRRSEPDRATEPVASPTDSRILVDEYAAGSSIDQLAQGVGLLPAGQGSARTRRNTLRGRGRQRRTAEPVRTTPGSPLRGAQWRPAGDPPSGRRRRGGCHRPDLPSGPTVLGSRATQITRFRSPSSRCHSA